MVVRSTVGVLAACLLAVGCGSSQKGTGGSPATGSGGGDLTPAGGNSASAGNTGSAAGASSTAGSGSSQGGNGQGGSVITGIGNGELDASCMARTSISSPGSRIVLRNAVTAEGDKVAIGFYDNQKKQECEVIQDAEGKYRCMPPASFQRAEDRFFLDDKCSDEIEYRGACSVDSLAEAVSSDACDNRRRLFGWGERIADSMVYSIENGECKPYFVLNNLYRRGADLVPTEYAEVKPAVWRGAGRIWAQGYQGEGDLHLVSAFVDSQIDEPCDFQLLSDGKEHCVPTRLGSIQFTDASCKKTLISSSTTCGARPARYASGRTGDTCKLGVTMVQADAAFTEPLYVRSGCMATTSMGISAFSAKATADTDFVAVEPQTLSSDTGRLKPMYRSASDGGCFFHDWWDEELQTRCSFGTNARELPYYCLPTVDPASPALNLNTFSDSECKVPAPYVQMPSCSGAKPPKYFITDGASCVAGWRTIRTLASTPSTPPPLWVSNGSSCSAYTPSATATYYAAGDALPSSMFVQATVEP